MKSIVVTYPDFQKLPRAIKRLLVASESFFFQESSTSPEVAVKGQSVAMLPKGAGGFGGILPPLPVGWRN